MSRPLPFLLLAAALLLAPGASRAAGPGDHLLGTPAPAWEAEHWLHSEALDLEDLRGRVVLVRFWTAPGCPFCSATAPSLNTLHERYGDRGLTVVGLYHHKSRTPLDPADVARHAQRLGFLFPVAIDPDWQTLRRWWLDRADSGWTSVSFLLDQKGVIRWIHPGGKYVEGDPDFAALEAEIRLLLREASNSPGSSLPPSASYTGNAPLRMSHTALCYRIMSSTPAERAGEAIPPQSYPNSGARNDHF